MLLRTLFLYFLMLSSNSFGQAINIGIPYLPATYDPHNAQVVYNQRVLGDLYEGLLAEAADGTNIPGMAKSWERSADGLKYTFKLRKNGKWSDGTAVTAKDFLLAFHRLFSEKTYDYERFQIITGSVEWEKGKPLGVKVLNDYTIEFSLLKPYPLFSSLMASPSAYPIPSHVWKKVKDSYYKQENAVTNGPFTFKSKIETGKSKLSLIRNTHYWDVANVKIAAVNYLSSTSAGNATRDFSSGKYDVLYEFEAHQYKMVKKLYPNAIRNVAQLHGYYVIFNHKLEALKNVNVRKALSLAIDRNALVNTTDAQNMRSLNTIVPSIRTHTSTGEFEFNIAKARQLMTTAGYTGSRPLKLKFSAVDSKQDKRILSFLRHAWMAINVRIDIEFVDFKNYVNTLNSNAFELTRLSWFAGIEDAYDFMVLYHSTDKINFGQFESSAFDELIISSTTEIDSTKRKKILTKAETIMISDVANIPLFSSNILSLVNPKVKGWVDNATNTHRSRWLSMEP